MPSAIPIIQTSNQQLNQIQNNLTSVVNNILSNKLISGQLMQKVYLQYGQNRVAHGLGAILNGWFITRQRNSCVIYDTQDSNPQPDQTLYLNVEIVPQNQTYFVGSTTNASPTVSTANTSNLKAGMNVYAQGAIPYGVTIIKVAPNSSITLSSNASSTSSNQLILGWSNSILSTGSVVVDLYVF